MTKKKEQGDMGIYLNSSNAYTLYQNETSKPYFVDKSLILEELIPLVQEGSSYICITRPRRFGKTVMANMIGAFFAKGGDSHELFDKLAIADSREYKDNLNQHNVIHIRFNETPADCSTYRQYISRISSRLRRDLKYAYPEIDFGPDEAVWDVLSDIHEFCGREKFIFVLDEWDYIFHCGYVKKEDRLDYLAFLRNLLKDQPYVSMAYMTGILPIAKYASGSELNMFAEFTMAKSPAFGNYFGFTDKEVDDLYGKYLKNCVEPCVSREDLRKWYDGYHTASGERLYNPRSAVYALQYNHLESYWTSSGPYDEIFYYIEKNVDDVRDDLALMAAGIPVRAKVREYAAVSMDLRTRDEIFSAMVVYGFLSCSNGYVSIPNKELMEKFDDMLCKESSLGYVNRLAKESGRMLQATLSGDTRSMEEILEFAHNTETPLLNYNNEAELTAIVNLVYLAARDTYRVEREDKAGIGYVDFIFYPEDKRADCMILELKVDHTPEEAIAQIRDRKYALRFQGKMGKKRRYTGRILAVGIGYDKNTKKHSCRIEVLVPLE